MESLTKLLWSLVDHDATTKFKYKTHCLLLVKLRECKTIPFAFCLTSPLKQVKIILDLGGRQVSKTERVLLDEAILAHKTSAMRYFLETSNSWEFC